MKGDQRPEFALIDEAVARNKSVPSLTLARIIWKKHPDCFLSLRAVYSAVRYRRRCVGARHRRNTPRAQLGIAPASKFSALNPLRLPASDEHDWHPFKMDACEKVLVIGDLHLPYHNMAALTCALQDGRKAKVDGILINGDLADFHQLSHFVRDPKKRSFKGERQIVIQFLGRLRELFPKARIVFKEGNHDERLWNFLAPRVPEIFQDEEVARLLGLPSLLKLDQFGVEHVAEKREVMLGKLPVLHGHEFRAGFAPPVNPARGAYLKAKECVLLNHHHKTSEHTETTLGRRIITTWSLGCLCELRPAFDPYNGWNHGHALVEISKGDFHVINKRQLNGSIL
jgi:predicted phosphodiesterase